jgi:tetratricopeptide (TPR) repeat protein
MKKLIALILFIFTLVIYLLTTSPFLQAGDSAEMAGATISLGVPHQPSYPIYVALTNLFVKMPIPYIPEHLNLPVFYQYDISNNYQNSILIYRSGSASALFQSLAAVLLYLAILEIIKKTKIRITFLTYIVAAIVTCIYSFSETIWLYATKPEVFSLNNFFACLILYISIRWWNSSKKRPRLVFFIVLSLALSHHQTIILILPSLFVLYLFRNQDNGDKVTQTLSKWFSYPGDKKFNKLVPAFFGLLVGSLPFMFVLCLIASKSPYMNWGEVNNFVDIFRALLRADYGTFSAYLTNIKNPTHPMDQLPFFFSHLVSDFSALIILFSVISLSIIYKAYKNLSIFLTTLFLFTGPIFLVYANFSLDSPFSQATVARFYMLPSLTIPIVLSLGIILLIQKIDKLSESQANEYLKTSKVILVFVLIGLMLQQSLPNMPKHSDLTYQFVKTAIESTEPDAMILVTGDIPTMGAQYLLSVEGAKKQRTIFSPGQLHLDWVNEQLKKRYPDLQIPDPLPGKQFTSARQIIDANWGKYPIYISSEFVDIDKSIQEKYTLWPKNYLLKVELPGTQYKLEDYIQENEQLYNSLNLSEFNDIRNQRYQLETPLLTTYSIHYYNLGAIFYTVHKYNEAIKSFNHSLTINPDNPQPYKALATLFYFTDDYNQKQPQLALSYLDKYIQLSKELTVEDYNNTQSMIQKIVSDAKQAETQEQQDRAEEQKMLEEQLKQSTISAEVESIDSLPEPENQSSQSAVQQQNN